MVEQNQLTAYFAGAPHAVVGASRDRSKYGNKVLRAFLQRGLPVYPVNPHAEQVEGLKSYPDLLSLPEKVHGVCIITPPQVTEAVIQQAGQLGIKHVWLQPGAENDLSVEQAADFQMNMVSGGPCILITLRYHE